jgi:hypothetical protein
MDFNGAYNNLQLFMFAKKNMKKFSILIFPSLLYLLLGSIHNISAQVELKTNIPTLAFGVPNIGLEFQVGKKTSVQLDVLGSFWDSIEGNPLQINQTFFEFRYYSKADISGWFVGAHLGYGMFTLQKPLNLIITPRYSTQKNADGSYKSGRSVYHGLTIGYKKRINKRFSLELFMGAGYAMSNYKGYKEKVRVDVPLEDNRAFNGSGEVLIYRGGLMLIYKILPYQKKEE